MFSTDEWSSQATLVALETDVANVNVSDNTTVLPTEVETPLWSRIFDITQLTCIIIGFLANLITMVTLIRNGADFSRPIRILFRHQSFADCLVCLMACVIMLQPFMWLPGVYVLDIIVCYAWHGQAFYWGAVTLSTYNLVIIALERYIAVCRPFDYTEFCQTSGKKVAVEFFFLYVICIVITHGTYIQTRLVSGHCLPQYAFDGVSVEMYFMFFVIFTYITTYFCPAAIMAAFYGMVAVSLRRRGKDTRLAQSKTIDRASAELTKTAFAVTIIFIVTIGYDLHYYLFGYIGVLDYILNSPIQKVGVFLSNLNSCANPFVYTILMPMFRASLMKTFGCQGRRARSNRNQSGTGNRSPGIMTAASSEQTIASNVQE